MSAGFLLASNGKIDWSLYLAAFFGLAFVIASACVINNYIDRDIDGEMDRTSKRALVKKSISNQDALVFAAILGASGGLILGMLTTSQALLSALFGFFAYVVLYSLWAKRSTIHGTIIGSLSGAVPPVVGYTAVSGRIDFAAVVLFLMLVFWQMPHFYAIALYRSSDYQAANIPVLPLKKSFAITQKYMVVYVSAFLIASASLSIAGYTGYIYLICVTLLGFWWLGIVNNEKAAEHQARYGRSVFRSSLTVILITSILISANAWLP